MTSRNVIDVGEAAGRTDGGEEKICNGTFGKIIVFRHIQDILVP